MSDSRQGNRASARSLDSRTSATKLRASFRETGTANIPLAQAAKVHRAADMTRAKAERHYEKHREKWVAKQYTRLLLKSAATLTLAPPGMASDPKSAMMARASNMVAGRQANRLERIDSTKRAMLDTGRLRHTRKLDWGRGLGD